MARPTIKVAASPIHTLFNSAFNANSPRVIIQRESHTYRSTHGSPVPRPEPRADPQSLGRP
ncbi:hypothetical protein GCM10010299_44300 [Streptomyces tanashiensis]|nr:hypothetical protein GCM10010299_44300 [Streptomyces tanashiensis]